MHLLRRERERETEYEQLQPLQVKKNAGRYEQLHPLKVKRSQPRNLLTRREPRRWLPRGPSLGLIDPCKHAKKLTIDLKPELHR